MKRNERETAKSDGDARDDLGHVGWQVENRNNKATRTTFYLLPIINIFKNKSAIIHSGP